MASRFENSGLRCAVALSRLCLVGAVATLFLTLQGTAVVAAKQRRCVDNTVRLSAKQYRE